MMHAFDYVYPADLDPACQFCGSVNIRISGKHGWCECDDCGEDGPVGTYGDWESGQEWPHEIPPGYVEP